MSFTLRSIVHTFLNADGTPASGKVTFDLGGPMTNDGASIIPSEVVAPLDSAGGLTVTLAANDDPDTTPAGVNWLATVRVLGTQATEYSITVPSAGTGPVDFGSLLPDPPQVS